MFRFSLNLFIALETNIFILLGDTFYIFIKNRAMHARTHTHTHTHTERKTLHTNSLYSKL